MTETTIKTADQFRADAAQILSDGVVVAEVLATYMKHVSRFTTEMDATYNDVLGEVHAKYGLDMRNADGGFDGWMAATGYDAVFQMLCVFKSWSEEPPSPEDIACHLDGLRQLADDFNSLAVH